MTSYTPQELDELPPVRRMQDRPLSVTVISGLAMLTGIVGLVEAGVRVTTHEMAPHDLVWVGPVRLLPIVAGLFMLRGRDWARWFLLAWMALHVVLGAFHSRPQFLVHGLLLGALAYFLFRRPARLYFSPAGQPPRKGES